MILTPEETRREVLESVRALPFACTGQVLPGSTATLRCSSASSVRRADRYNDHSSDGFL
jgi:hypothetical protein